MERTGLKGGKSQRRLCRRGGKRKRAGSASTARGSTLSTDLGQSLQQVVQKTSAQ